MELEKSVKRQVKDTMEYYKVLDNLEEVPVDILRVMYKDLLENSIPKKKIEDKIEELKTDNKYYMYGESGIKYQVLQELLEE